MASTGGLFLDSCTGGQTCAVGLSASCEISTNTAVGGPGGGIFAMEPSILKVGGAAPDRDWLQALADANSAQPSGSTSPCGCAYGPGAASGAKKLVIVQDEARGGQRVMATSEAQATAMPAMRSGRSLFSTLADRPAAAGRHRGLAWKLAADHGSMLTSRQEAPVAQPDKKLQVQVYVL
jgi:hypothetical protein